MFTQLAYMDMRISTYPTVGSLSFQVVARRPVLC